MIVYFSETAYVA